MQIENTAIRLKQLMKERKLRQVDLLEMVKPFCEKYNVKMNKSDISQYLSGTVKPGQEKLAMLGMALNINEAWLMGLDVPMEKVHYIKALESIQNESIINSSNLSQKELLLLENYNKLNDLGKDEASKRVAELAMIPTYIETKDNVTELITATRTKFDEKPHLMPKASHDKKGTFTAEEYRHDDDIMNDYDFWNK